MTFDETERIIGVAIKYANGITCSLPRPNRHHHIIRALAAMGVDHPTPASSVQGFVTDSGRFVDRREAGRIADATGQAKRTVGSRVGGDLYSEDLW